MHEVNLLRVTESLRKLVQDTASHCSVSVSDVLRCTAVWKNWQSTTDRFILLPDYKEKSNELNNQKSQIQITALPVQQKKLSTSWGR